MNFEFCVQIIRIRCDRRGVGGGRRVGGGYGRKEGVVGEREACGSTKFLNS